MSTSAAAVQEDSLIVDGEGDGQSRYETIQAAIDNANDGDTITVRAGEYSGFVVDKDVTITTTGAVIQSDITLQEIEIVDGAAPVIEGFTLRADGIFAPGGGAWTLRDVDGPDTSVVTGESSGWRIEGSELGLVVASGNAGDWTIRDATVEQVQADRTTGDWTIVDTQVELSIFTDNSTGDWEIRKSRLGSTANPEAVVLTAPNTEGDWTVADSEIVGTRSVGISARGSGGNWQVTGTTMSGKLDARKTSGNWQVRSSYIARTGVSETSVFARETEGLWSVSGSYLPGDVTARNAVLQGDATGNYWGQLGGPREDQCRGNVNCGQPLRSPPVEPPEFSAGPDESDNREPIALISASRQPVDGRVYVNAGEEITFDGSLSVDPDDSIESYDWEVAGDGSSGETLTRTFETAGTYSVLLRVSDGIESDSKTLAVEVLRPDEQPPAGDDGFSDVPETFPPVAVLETPVDSVAVGDDIRLSAAESTALQREALSYQWDIDGDGEPDRTTANPVTTTSFDEPGEYTVSVTVSGAQGGTDTDTVTLQVGPEGGLPEATFDVVLPSEDGSVATGESIVFDASASTVPDSRDLRTYEWEFGDGTTRTVDARFADSRDLRGRSGTDGVSPVASHTYDEPGTYDVTLTVTDSAGFQSQTTQTVEVDAGESIQISEVQSASKPGPMIAGLGLSNDYVATVTSEADIEEVVFEFPNGETFEGDNSGSFTAEDTWYAYSVPIDEVTRPGSNIVTVRAISEDGRVETGTFNIDVLDPPGWFEFAMGDNPTVKRSERRQDRWVIQSDSPSFPGRGPVGLNFNFDLPVSEISGDYSIGIGVNYGFEYIFAERLAEAGGGGSVSLSTPTEGLDLESDIGVGFGGSRTRGFSLDVTGQARVTPDGSRVTFERGSVEFATSSSRTIPIGGVAVYIPKVDTTIGVANVDLTLSYEIAPGAGLEVNDARTALVVDEIRLRNDIGLKVTAGVGTSIDPGIGRVGAEARGIVDSEGSFVTEIYPDSGFDQVAVELRAGVRGCLGPCGTEWLLDDRYELVSEDNSVDGVRPVVALPGASADGNVVDP